MNTQLVLNESKVAEEPDIRLEVLKRRYLRKDETGAIIETPEQMFQRPLMPRRNSSCP
jgi:ribonucleotide reductase alpha subunit